MRRRTFITFIGSAAFAACGIANADAETRAYRVAGLFPFGLMAEGHPYMKLLLPGLNRRGYVVGQNLMLETPPTAQTSPGPVRLLDVLDDLKAKKIDVRKGSASGLASMSLHPTAGLPSEALHRNVRNASRLLR